MKKDKAKSKAHNPFGPTASEVLSMEMKNDPELVVQIDNAREARIQRMISSLVVAARKRGGLSQSDVARKAGMWPAHVSRLESKSSTREPSISLLARVAHAMGYRLDVRFVPSRTAR